jgi:hypothetical protein
MEHVFTQIISGFRSDLWKNYCILRNYINSAPYTLEEKEMLIDDYLQIIINDISLLRTQQTTNNNSSILNN